MLINFDIFPGRANSLKLALTDDGALIADHRAITRLAVYVGGTLYDSQTTPELFDLTRTGLIEIKLGDASPALTVGRYACRLIVYSAGEYANGYVWPEGFVVRVWDEAG